MVELARLGASNSGVEGQAGLLDRRLVLCVPFRAFEVRSGEVLSLFSRLCSWKTVRSESNEMIVKLVRPGIG